MPDRQTLGDMLRYYSSVTLLYAFTLLFASYLFHPFGLFLAHAQPIAYSQAHNGQKKAAEVIRPIIAGKPVRIVIPSVKIDVAVDEGYYNEADQTWTLSGYHAHFAMLSILANDTGGNTLIYGHYNPYVFYHLKEVTTGSVAEVYTDNGHVFRYIFESAENVKPDNMSVFQYDGPPILTIQTCSGSWYEWRRLFRFTLQGVDS